MRENLPCSTPNGSRRISNNSAGSRSRGATICVSCAEQSNCRENLFSCVSPARAESSNGIVNDTLPKVRCTDCCHCFTQDAIGCFAVHPFLRELLRAEVALLLVNVIVDDARVGNIVIIRREPPPDRSRDGSQIGQEILWYLDNPAKYRALVLEWCNELEIGSVGVSRRSNGFLPAQAPEIQFTQELIAHASERETIRPAAQDD